MKILKHRVTLKAVLEMMGDLGEVVFLGDRKTPYKIVFGSGVKFMEKDYFPVDMERAVTRLVRKGWVKKEETAEGTKIILTEDGKKKALFYKLADLKPKMGKWDGKWRVVLFDIEDREKRKRDELRAFLEQLGFKKYQESMYICPYDCEGEVKYLREILNVADEVKTGVLEKIENDEDLRIWFGV